MKFILLLALLGLASCDVTYGVVHRAALPPGAFACVERALRSDALGCKKPEGGPVAGDLLCPGDLRVVTEEGGKQLVMEYLRVGEPPPDVSLGLQRLRQLYATLHATCAGLSAPVLVEQECRRVACPDGC